ncbi:ATP phosphoribosyltransferase regulatory subunit [Streptococcus moroccensis]|uniref:ATP phosphoribosyltransferase regulatory subunit n=1 Tax=Streptococcus moroccensis TaxID=1451356 RepID=A0ABT9YV29_9STRE|nr:ATP phosphoribosyltransferase regulatory subunit [Streptococcus moroccensis]MDQ0222950.1 ATP phosphoribosyltransferase regulatory subunit [Streptococcus moroccensis]
MTKTQLPIGMRDKLFKRANSMYKLEHDISDLLMDKGYHRIETPTLEHSDVFSNTINTNYYNLFDKKGALLTLRPDITSQIGRVMASTRVQAPIRFSYSGKVFYYNEELRGLVNERTQAGIELIGYPVQSALQEAVLTASEALQKAGLTQYHFEFSHARILQIVFESLALDEENQAKLETLIRDKNITGLHAFTNIYPSEFSDLLKALPYLFGDSQLVLKKARQLVKDEAILEALDNLETLIQSLSPDLAGTTIDLAQLSTQDYYTGILFKVFNPKVPNAFMSGGRYDKLFKRFGGEDLTAVGWAIDIDAIYDALKDSLLYEGGER